MEVSDGTLFLYDSSEIQKWTSIAILVTHLNHILGAHTPTAKCAQGESTLCVYLCCTHQLLHSTEGDKHFRNSDDCTLWECAGEVGRDLSHPASGINTPALSSSTSQSIASAKKLKNRKKFSWSLIFHGTLVIRMPGNSSRDESKKLGETLQQKPALPSSNPDSHQAMRDF